MKKHSAEFMLNIKIIDKRTLYDAADVVRDGEFSDADFAFNSSQHIATLSIWKKDDVRYERSPSRRFELVFRFVVRVEFIDRGRAPGPHPFGGMCWDGFDTILIDTYDGLTVKLTVGTLDGILRDTGELKGM